MKNINVIGVDIGYGYTKVYGSGNLSRTYPSQVSEAQARGAFDSHENTIIVNGKSYIVGDNIGTFGDYSVSESFLGTPEYLALLGEALSSSKFPFHVLVLGLPPGIYDETRNKDLQKVITSASISTQSGIVRIPQVVKIIPQGAGIYFDYLNSLETSGGFPNDNNTVIIDLGHYTLDLVLFSRKSSGQVEYVHGMSQSYPVGVSQLYDEVKQLYSKEYGGFLNNDEKIMRLVRDGQYTHAGETYTLEIKSVVDEYIYKKVFKVIDSYNKKISANSNKTIDKIVIGGGGVQCLGSATGKAVVVKDPQMSNARGYYYYGVSMAAEPLAVRLEDAPLRAATGN